MQRLDVVLGQLGLWKVAQVVGHDRLRSTLDCGRQDMAVVRVFEFEAMLKTLVVADETIR